MSIAGGVFNAIRHGAAAGCDVVQIFTRQSNQWKAKPLTDEDVSSFLAAQKETGVRAVCAHNSYLINLASPNDDLWEKSYTSMKEEYERCHTLKIPNIVMHPGSHVGSGEEAGLKRIGRALNRLLSDLPDVKTAVCLEITAGQGTNLGYKFEQLASIIDMVEDKSRMGVCLDSCHLFGAGYALQTEKEYRATMKHFNDLIGYKYLKVYHLNDSLKPFAARKDRHEHIGKGLMGLEPFRFIMNDSRLRRVPKILETPKGEDYREDIENLRILRSLIEVKETQEAVK
jgi:deoxyribonuclease-4